MVIPINFTNLIALRYKKNEIFIDAIENVNILYSNTGSLLHADVAGEIKVCDWFSVEHSPTPLL